MYILACLYLSTILVLLPSFEIQMRLAYLASFKKFQMWVKQPVHCATLKMNPNAADLGSTNVIQLQDQVNGNEHL